MIDGLSIGVSGLLAAQRGLDVVSHNLANVNTPGYTRQRVLLQEAPPITGARAGKGGGAYGLGVVVGGIQLLRDELVERTIRDQRAQIGAMTASADLAQRVDEVIGRIDGGLGDALDRFFDAWNELAITPELGAARSGVLEAGADLGAALQQARGLVDAVAEEAAQRLRSHVAEVNDLARQIGVLNLSIMDVAAQGGTAGDLINERTRVLDRLAQLTGASVRTNADGSADVLIPGGMLVSGRATSEVSLVGVPPSLVWTAGGQPAAAGGAIGALVDALDGGFDPLYQQIDLMATGLIDAVNTLHAAGTDLDGTTGTAFFTGTSAADIAVNAALTVRGVAASAGGTAADGNQALAIGDLRTAAIIATPGAPTTPVGSPTDSLANLLAEVGRRAQSARRASEAAAAVGDQLEVRRGQVSGVSTDEELTEMIRFQRAYEASARVITVMDEVLDLLVNRLGIVGR